MNIRKFIILTFVLSLCSFSLKAQSAIIRDFKPVCDSLNVLLQERNGIASPKISLNAVMKRGSTLDFYFTEKLCDCPWYKGDPQWFRTVLEELFPEKYQNYGLGQI